jgi:hypothetical protein
LAVEHLSSLYATALSGNDMKLLFASACFGVVALALPASAQDSDNPYPPGSVEWECHDGDIAACTQWRDRECRNGNRAACDYYVARKQKDPYGWCLKQYSDDADSYRFCITGSPDH